VPSSRDLDVGLVDVDEQTLDRLVRAATEQASAAEVTAPVTPGDEWTPERIAWLREFHRDRRSGIDGPLREATWAIVYGTEVVGSVRLQRTDRPDELETGIWLTRPARGRGVASAALAAAFVKATEAGARTVRATTTPGNAAALELMRRLGFDIHPAEDQHVHAVRRLG
jgi:RimJ/RimL family protein N-acetyltransferase